MAKSTKKKEMNDISVFGINNLLVRTPSETQMLVLLASGYVLTVH